jgi:hypothetical protein
MTSNWLYATYVRSPIRFYEDPKPINGGEEIVDILDDVTVGLANVLLQMLIPELNLMWQKS